MHLLRSLVSAHGPLWAGASRLGDDREMKTRCPPLKPHPGEERGDGHTAQATVFSWQDRETRFSVEEVEMESPLGMSFGGWVGGKREIP